MRRSRSFTGRASLYNRDNREYLVKAFPVNIRFDDDRIYLACYFPMPFFHSAHIQLAGGARDVSDVAWSVSIVPLDRTANYLSYFHATYRDFPSPVMGKDLVLLDTRGVERAPEWSGQPAGTSFIFSHEADLTTLEGDPRFFFDDSRTPQVQGTGTEEWGGRRRLLGRPQHDTSLLRSSCGRKGREERRQRRGQD